MSQLFQSTEPSARRIYLDHAATSWPKFAPAVQAAFDFVQHCGATAGRGAYTSALVAEGWLQRARHALANLVEAGDATAVAMCSSGTHALNAGLQGLLRDGDHVIATEIEHNSVLRPLQALSDAGKIEVSYATCDASGMASIDAARALVQPNTRLLCVGHASNVTGAIQDITAWRALANECGARLLVDASQTLGYVPVHFSSWGIDILAAAGHKGLRALPGSGFLVVSQELQSQLKPMAFGGTGRASEQLDAGQIWPASVEVGNLNMLSVVSMAVAAESLLGDPHAYLDWQPPFERLRSGLRELPCIRMLTNHRRPCVPLVSLVVENWDIHELATVLDASFGIEVRAGWHCAALVHPRLGTDQSGGTLRLSTGHTTNVADVEATLAAFAAILGPQ